MSGLDKKSASAGLEKVIQAASSQRAKAEEDAARKAAQEEAEPKTFAEAAMRKGESVGRASAKIAKNIGDAAAGISFIGRSAAWIGRKAGEVKEAFKGLYELPVVGPVLRGVGASIGFAARGYAKLWDRVVYKNDKETGERVLSRKRAGGMLAATFMAAVAMTPTTAGEFVRFFTVEPAVDAVMMAATMRTDKMNLYASEEIVPEHNIHSVRGCAVDQCSESDAIYMRVKPRLSHDIWKLVAHGNPIYVPDHVVAPIAAGVNRCEVTHYGIRLTNSFIGRVASSLQVYPTMLEAKCRNISTITSHDPSSVVSPSSLAPQ